MSDQDLGDLCRQIAREQADGLMGRGGRGATIADPVTFADRLNGYAAALEDLAGGLREGESERPPR